MPGIDKPTGRVVALIVLLIVVAAALHGYLPAHDRAAHAESGGNRAAMLFVIAALAGTIALLAVAVIARLRDPRAVAPSAGNVSDMLGTGRGRPKWRVVLIGLGVIVVWLLIVMLLSRLSVPHGGTPSALPSEPTTSPSAHATAPPPQPQHSQNNTRDMVGILIAAMVPMLLIIVAGSAIMAGRRWKASPPSSIVDDNVERPPAPERTESLVRAAELGLA